MLWELTDYQGRSLDLLISGIVPDLPLVGAILLIALMMTAALLIPLTAVGFDAAVGLLIGVGAATYLQHPDPGGVDFCCGWSWVAGC